LLKKLFLLCFFLNASSIISQKKDITLEDIFAKNTFITQKLKTFHSIQNVDFYTILNHYQERTLLEKYDYSTLNKLKTVVSGNQLNNLSSSSIRIEHMELAKQII